MMIIYLPADDCFYCSVQPDAALQEESSNLPFDPACDTQP